MGGYSGAVEPYTRSGIATAQTRGYSVKRCHKEVKKTLLKAAQKKNVFLGFSDKDDPLGISQQVIAEAAPRKPAATITYGKTLQDEYHLTEVENEMKKELSRFREALADVKLGRQALASFGALPVTISSSEPAASNAIADTSSTGAATTTESTATQTVSLSNVAQITVISATIVSIRPLDIRNYPGIVKSIKEYNSTWTIHQERANDIRLTLPKTTKQTREALVLQVKELHAESIKTLREIEEDCILDIKSTMPNAAWAAKEVKQLRELAKDYRQEAQEELKRKTNYIMGS